MDTYPFTVAASTVLRNNTYGGTFQFGAPRRRVVKAKSPSGGNIFGSAQAAAPIANPPTSSGVTGFGGNLTPSTTPVPVTALGGS